MRHRWVLAWTGTFLAILNVRPSYYFIILLTWGKFTSRLISCWTNCWTSTAFSMATEFANKSFTVFFTDYSILRVFFSTSFKSLSFHDCFLCSLTNRWTRLGFNRNCLATSDWLLLSVKYVSTTSSISLEDSSDLRLALYLLGVGDSSYILCLISFSSNLPGLFALVEYLSPFLDLLL